MGIFKRSSSSRDPLAGPGYVILNIIRVFNIITLLAVIAGSTVMLVKTFVVSKFFFFDGVSHVITAFLALFLIITELPLFRSYIATNWPLLSPTSGFVTLGTLMLILGVSILGNLNKEATSQTSLGPSFWRIVIASGILALIFGALNLFASYIFRNAALGITARQVRAHGAVAGQKSSTTMLHYSPSSSAAGGASSARRRSFHLGRSDTLPSYYTKNSDRAEARQTRNISAPVVGDHTQFEKFQGSDEIQRPDLARHPALVGGRF